MLIVFGAICQDTYLELEDFPENERPAFASHYTTSRGGKASNQALAAARAGAKTALVGKVGDDPLSKAHLEALRREGVLTSGSAKSEQTLGTRLYIRNAQGQQKVIIALGASEEISPDQVPDDILKKENFLLLQTEISMEANVTLLERAKKCGATTLMNLSPSVDFSQKALNNLDYLIINQIEATQLADKLDLKTNTCCNNGTRDCYLKIAHALSKQGNLTCIITQGAKGCIAYTKNHQKWRVKALDIEEIVDRTGAQDAYCGTLAACLYAQMTLPRAMKRASIAASLACTKQGGQNTLPFMADIDEYINDLEDSVQMEF